MKLMLGFIGTGLAGTAVGVGARSVYWHLMGVSIITEQTLAPVGIFVGILITMTGLTWWIGRLITRFEMSISEHAKELTEIKRMIATLPCPGKTNTCQPKSDL